MKNHIEKPDLDIHIEDKGNVDANGEVQPKKKQKKEKIGFRDRKVSIKVQIIEKETRRFTIIII